MEIPLRRSLRLSITLWATLAFAAAVAVVGALVADFLKSQALRVDELQRTSGLCIGVVVVESGVSEPRWTDHTLRCAHAGPVDGDVSLAPVPLRALLPPGLPLDDAVVLANAQFSSHRPVPRLSLWPFTDPESVTVAFDGSPRTVPVAFLRDAEEERFVAAQRTLNRQVLMLVGGALFLVALAAALVWTTVGRALRPVEAIRRELAHITEHDLARRVPVPRRRNEIARLATTVNATLDRLRTALDDNRRFVADASHELRSPIAALRAELEIAHAHPDLADWRAVVDGALRDTYRLQHLATDLLLLARLDHTTTATGGDTVDLADLVREETSRNRTRHRLTVEVDARPAVVRGSRALLGRLLGNLLDNAERHAHDHITVRLAAHGTSATLEVVDDGPGIPPADRERVFDRFTRLDHARTRDTGGTGLGLPIARRIATHHNGTLDVADHPHGTRFVATLPRIAGGTR
ncbi:sensor histidine kinase [Saccharothrix variisporea]|uniref:histidine kinase n=1 Tax=Saccharothrix variisporea TaxID=543527 RepID=A0A495XPU8_9PSEU|nr:HAMP domain-containing sensor histidine kinase [Saccharothrix variisporea]RKT74934.1 signal transduction histidine kinase [Saccharothrix variisporea]